ncbi:MAG: glycosyltransferase [Porticoccaceae bacterium]|nr:glycosyltransferase [Porticoccaceae bacterium]
MRILYGIQGTGNGHITRARAMAPALAAAGLAVDYLISGRDRARLFDMDPFGDFDHRDGLTFAVREGRISSWHTLVEARPLLFVRDIRQLDVSGYDLVLTDYEPVTAWAARLKQKRVIGLGHQYAFRYPVPQYRNGPVQQALMTRFAPADQHLGLHWHHFGQPILPPIAPVGGHPVSQEKGLIVVYLPFESTATIAALLAPFERHRFHIYHPDSPLPGQGLDHLQWHRPSREGFQADLHRCAGVICNAGFELASETLQLGKKLLVKPVAGQPEQYSNALALDLLGYGYTMSELNRDKVDRWLASGCATRIVYPDVAAAICQWLKEGAREPIQALSDRLWRQTELPDLTAQTRTDHDLRAPPATSSPGRLSNG